VDGLLFYVMPYVAGESLRQKLERQTQLSIEETLELARQVASALDCAHRQGIIHRDIKPENILLQEGEAVVADFGIARAVSVAGGERLTETGLSLGTPAYMSPEQASGDQKIDSRSDIYSLASVMYEMLAGEPPFTGPTTPAIIARQLVDPVPSIRTVRPTVPEELERAIEKALAKVPADRYDSAGAFVEAADAAAQVEVVPTRERRMPRRQVSPKAWSVGAAVALTATAAITAGVMLLSSDWLGGGPSQFTVSNIQQVTLAPEVEWDPAISPDGSEVVYAVGSGRQWHLFVKDLGGGRTFALTADRPGAQRTPRWTPDGHSIVFQEPFRGSGVTSHMIHRLGGPTRVIVDARVWDLRDNRVVYTRRAHWGARLVVRSVEGGEETFVAPDQFGAHSVAWSPDGTKLAYVRGNSQWVRDPNISPSSIWLVGADGGEPVQVTDSATLNVSPAWMPDGRHLLFISDRDGPPDIYALRLDASGRTRGRPVRVTTGLSPHSISVSADGSTVAYSQFSFRQNIWQIDIPETGSVSISEARPLTVGSQIVENHALSPDGRLLAFDSNRDGNLDIYLMPADGGEARRVTRDPGDDYSPDFSPDGSEIVFYSARHGTRDLFLISPDGRDEVHLTDHPGEDLYPTFSPDGLRIAFMRFGAMGLAVYLISRDSLGGEWSAPELLPTRVTAPYYPRWSPDGGHISYRSSKEKQIWIVSLQGEQRLLFDGTAAGILPRWPEWSADGRFIYFDATDTTGVRTLYTIPVEGGALREVIRYDDPTKNETQWQYTLGNGKAYFTVKEVESDIWVMDLEMN